MRNERAVFFGARAILLSLEPWQLITPDEDEQRGQPPRYYQSSRKFASTSIKLLLRAGVNLQQQLAGQQQLMRTHAWL
jgi:hypothetical protein